MNKAVSSGLTISRTARKAGLLFALAALASTAAWSADHAHGAAKPARKVTPGTFCAIQDAKACQDAVTPDLVLKRLKDGNKRFVSGKPLKRNELRNVKATSEGQFPLASIISCIDSRAPAEIVFDQGIGDIFNARVAGNIVNEDILGSIEYASKVAGSKLVVVLGHTSCGAVKGACDDVKLGNLTSLVAKIRPVAVSTDPNFTGDRSSKNHSFVDAVAHANVKATVMSIREKSPILKEMEANKQIRIVGAMYEVHSGKVTWLD